MGRRRTSNLHLPERLYKLSRCYWYKPRLGKAINLGRSLAGATEALKRNGITPTRMDARHLSTIYWHARKNAKSREISFDLARADINDLWIRSSGRCELTYIPFDLENEGGYRRRPFAPSIDRIDNRSGYWAGNCRLVVVAINLAINEWGLEVFGRVARGFLRQGHPKIFPPASDIPNEDA